LGAIWPFLYTIMKRSGPSTMFGWPTPLLVVVAVRDLLALFEHIILGFVVGDLGRR
jgi:hypothetical protein